VNARMDCPLCGVPLSKQAGDSLNRANGITLFCANLSCPAQEVAGHGDNEFQAFRVIQEKYKKSVDNS
jgi:hypothetical protein